VPVVPEYIHEVIARLGSELPGGTQVIGVPAPEPHSAPSRDAIAPPSGLGPGVFGATVTTAQGMPGILTAGHVARPHNAAVWSGGVTVGRVSFTEDPSLGPPTTPLADVAVVTLAQPAQPGLGPSIQSRAVAAAYQLLECHTYHGVANGVVSAWAPFVVSPRLNGQWASCYIAIPAISQTGDSGAPVLLQGTDVIVGHDVGGSGQFASYAQSIGYQLAASRSQLRPYP
jgi:hypothetical protein